MKGNTLEGDVIMDSPPLLTFANGERSEYISIHTTNHSAVTTSRMLHEKYAGAKVCQGMFATAAEIESLSQPPSATK